MTICVVHQSDCSPHLDIVAVCELRDPHLHRRFNHPDRRSIISSRSKVDRDNNLPVAIWPDRLRDSGKVLAAIAMAYTPFRISTPTCTIRSESENERKMLAKISKRQLDINDDVWLFI